MPAVCVRPTRKREPAAQQGECGLRVAPSYLGVAKSTQRRGASNDVAALTRNAKCALEGRDGRTVFTTRKLRLR